MGLEERLGRLERIADGLPEPTRPPCPVCKDWDGNVHLAGAWPIDEAAPLPRPTCQSCGRRLPVNTYIYQTVTPEGESREVVRLATGQVVARLAGISMDDL